MLLVYRQQTLVVRDPRLEKKKRKSELTQYVLGRDADIAGMVWRMGSAVHASTVTKGDAAYFDLFLTHKVEYAKRGSHAPVTRLPVGCVAIEGDVLTIAIVSADHE